MQLGIISDTHGFLDPRALAALEGVDCILHAGDVGRTEVLDALRQVAPVIAVRGNNDRVGPTSELPEHAKIEMDGVRIQLVHERKRALEWDERVLVFGHSHRPLVECVDGRLLLNPGAAGRAGFHSEISVALLQLNEGEPEAEIVSLGARARRSA
jgi:putative phosphoesterase